MDRKDHNSCKRTEPESWEPEAGPWGLGQGWATQNLSLAKELCLSLHPGTLFVCAIIKTILWGSDAMLFFFLITDSMPGALSVSWMQPQPRCEGNFSKPCWECREENQIDKTVRRSFITQRMERHIVILLCVYFINAFDYNVYLSRLLSNIVSE